MIKNKKHEYKIVTFSIIIVLLFLFAFNITYAYFTATGSINGSLNFSNLDVKFGYRRNNTVYETIDTQTLVVAPNTTMVSRGDNFTLLYGTYNIDYLYFTASSDSCDYYVRFMLNAYKINADNSIDESVNYGRYFEIKCANNVFTLVRDKTNTVDTTQINNVYYMTSTLTNGQYYRFCDSITLLDSAPTDILDTNIQLQITFKAVQQPNEAFKSVFDDGWGYNSSWT